MLWSSRSESLCTHYSGLSEHSATHKEVPSVLLVQIVFSIKEAIASSGIKDDGVLCVAKPTQARWILFVRVSESAAKLPTGTVLKKGRREPSPSPGIRSWVVDFVDRRPSPSELAEGGTATRVAAAKLCADSDIGPNKILG